MLKLARTIGPAILALVLVAGCGSDDGGDDPGATDEETSAAPSDDESSTAAPERDANADLVIWTDSLKLEAVQAVADQFAEANGISVAVQAVSTDLQTNFVTANAAKNGPDVVVGAHDWIGNLVQNGAIVPLQLSADDLSGYSDEGGRGDDVRRPALRRALRHRGHRALPQHRRGPRRAEDLRRRGRRRPEGGQGRQGGVGAQPARRRHR